MEETLEQSLHRLPNLFVQMSGAPGSGKSTIANLLASSIGGVVFDHDQEKSSILEAGVPFKDAAKETYDLGWVFATNMIGEERSVIIDSTCNYREVLDRGVALAQEHGYSHWYVERQRERH